MPRYRAPKLTSHKSSVYSGNGLNWPTMLGTLVFGDVWLCAEPGATPV